MKRIRQSPNNGYTVVELLVGIAIIAILVSLLIPAIQSAREAARRTRCLSNVRQIGIATASFQSQHGTLPGGGWGLEWYGIRDRGYGLNQPGGLFFQLLPFVEGNTIDEIAPTTQQFMNPTQSVYDPFLQAELAIFRCASKLDRPADATLWNAHPKSIPLINPATLDYAANAGTNTLWYGFLGPNSISQGEDPAFAWPSATDFDGILGIHQIFRSRDIRDGASNTILAGEKHTQRASAGGWDPGDDQTPWQGFCADIARWTFEPPAPDDSRYGTQLLFGGSHAGLPVVMVGGETTLLSYEISEVVFRQLGSRAGGNE